MSGTLEKAEEKGTEVQPKESESRGSHLLQAIVTSVSIGVAALYTVGMMVTNEYLFTIGYSDFNLIRPKCIITGTWAILVMISCSGPALSLDRFKDGKITRKTLGIEFLAGYLVAVALGLIFSSVLVSHWSTRVFVGFLLVPVALAIVPLLYFSVVLTLYRDQQPKPSYMRHIPVLAFMLISPLIATVLIAFFIYPQVHSVLGGGRPLPAKLVLNDEGVKVWKQLSGSTLKGHDSVAADLDILYENESHIIVRLKHPSADTGSIAILDKKVILAVLPGPYSM
jgi:hypothetical protein